MCRHTTVTHHTGRIMKIGKVRKISILAISIFVLAIVGLYGYEYVIISKMTKSLKAVTIADLRDPSSTQLRHVRLMADFKLLPNGTFMERMLGSRPLNVIFTYPEDSLKLCGELNAKNAFGAYVGFKKFYTSGGKKPHSFIDSDSSDTFADLMCRTAGAVLWKED